MKMPEGLVDDDIMNLNELGVYSVESLEFDVLF
jgi:hypothetical protein